jgi:nucleolar GTP-binding protein
MKGFVLKLMPLLQYTTYKHIKERFSDRLWLNVVSKCDLLGKTAPTNFDCDDNDDELAQYKRFGPEGAIQVSVKGEIGMKEVSITHDGVILSHLNSVF